MTERENQVMMVELLRVLAGILTDVAQAYTNAMEARRCDGRGPRSSPRDNEEDETSMVQSLPAHKARRLLEASSVKVVKDVAQLLGSAYEQTTRSLMASLERMGAEESRRCSQGLLNKLIAMYGTKGTHGMPLEAESLLSGLVTFGSELGGDYGVLSAMDRYFVENWWGALSSSTSAGFHNSDRGQFGVVYGKDHGQGLC